MIQTVPMYSTDVEQIWTTKKSKNFEHLRISKIVFESLLSRSAPDNFILTTLEQVLANLRNRPPEKEHENLVSSNGICHSGTNFRDPGSRAGRQTPTFDFQIGSR